MNVLNAFRHQRFDTYILSIFADDDIGAQRLSASEIRHIASYGSRYPPVYVLNAFRHQRFDTTYRTKS